MESKLKYIFTLTCCLFVGSCVVEAAYSPLNPVFSLSCAGDIHVFPNTGALSTYIEAGIAKRFYETYSSMLKTRLKVDYPSITDAQFDTFFSFGPSFWLNLLRSGRTWNDISGLVSSEFNDVWFNLFQYPFDDTNIVVDWPNAKTTCSYTSWMNGESCSIQVKLPSYKVALAVKVEHCSGTLFPKITIFCDGANCDKVGKPCSANSQCPSEAICYKVPLNTNTTNLWKVATEFEVYNATHDTIPGCKSVVSMFTEAKNYVLHEVFDSSATPLSDNTDISVCFADVDDILDNVTQTLENLNISLWNANKTNEDCDNYCNSSGSFPIDFPPNFNTIQNISGEYIYNRYYYYCTQFSQDWTLSDCDRYRLQLACAKRVGLKPSDYTWQNIKWNCENYASCTSCTPAETLPSNYPPALPSNNCSDNWIYYCESTTNNWRYLHRASYCEKLKLQLQCEQAIGCMSTETQTLSNCMSNKCDYYCLHRNVNIEVPFISSFTGTPPPAPTNPTKPSATSITGGSVLFKNTCDNWIQIMPGTPLSVSMKFGYQKILTWIHSWLIEAEQCRASAAGGSLSSWQFQSRFGWVPLYMFFQSTLPVPSESELGPSFSDFRSWFEMPGWIQMPSTCTFATWRDEGSCKLQYIGLSSLFQSDITLNFIASKCSSPLGDGAMPEISVECVGSGCSLFSKIIPCPIPGSNSGCPTGTKCWNFDTEIKAYTNEFDIMGEILYKIPEDHVAPNALHNLVHLVANALGAADTSSNNYYCFFDAYGNHMLEFLQSNNTYLSDWAESQYTASGDVVTLTDLKAYGDNPGKGSESLKSGANFFNPSFILIAIIAAIISKLL